MYRLHAGPRFEYREQENERVRSSPCLSEKFPKLKALTVELGHYDSTGTSKNSQIRFTPNLDNARSVFRIDCPNDACIGGDFDLSASIAKAVAQRQTTIKAELCCQGWQSKTTINTVRCHNILRCTLSLKY
ncbi:MAG: hypothetical protein WCH84_11770 [Verrucomicrobiota bacterium]